MIAVLVSLAAKAETVMEMVPATPASAVDFTWLFIKMLFVLGAVTVLAILILKYGMPRTAFYKRLAKGSLLKILARQHIAPRKHLYLVEMGGRYLLLGVTDHAITPIVELSAEEVDKLTNGAKGVPIT